MRNGLPDKYFKKKVDFGVTFFVSLRIIIGGKGKLCVMRIRG